MGVLNGKLGSSEAVKDKLKAYSRSWHYVGPMADFAFENMIYFDRKDKKEDLKVR